MRLSKWVGVGVIGFALQGAAIAQIYESEDAEGVPDFSDTPSAGAEVVDLPDTNVMDAPPAEVAAPQPDATESAPLPAAAEPMAVDGESEDGAVYYGGDEEDNVRAQRRQDAERINNALPGSPDSGAPVMQPGQAAEAEAPMGEAGEPRHEEAVHAGGGGHR